MNAPPDLAPALCSLLQRQGGDAASGPALRCALDGGRWAGLHFQAAQQRWLLGVGCATQGLDEGVRARLEEALLRAGQASRWGLQQTAIGDGRAVELVDCDFPCAPALLTVAAVESQLQALWEQLAALVEGRPAHPGAPVLHRSARACGCAREFSARMQSLDAARPPGSSAAQELLLEDRLPVRIALHPHSHHWVFEAFVASAAALAGPLRRGLVSALLQVNGALLGGRTLVCSLDGCDRVVVISRWHADWAARTPWREWLAYSACQARRIRAAATAIAMQDDGGSRA